MAKIPVDMELKKAFQELQAKMLTTTQQIKVSDAQVDTLKRTIQHSKFILQPVPEIQKILSMKIKASEDKIKSIETNKSYLERNLKESEDNLRELISSKQQSR